MAKIIHRCPKCDKFLYMEDESKYFDPSLGCTLMCSYCNLVILGVDLSVCATCKLEKKKTIKCGNKLFSKVTYKGGSLFP